MRDFYADPERAASDEIDFGSSWRTQGEGPWKVVWLESTGELAAFDPAGDEVVVIGFADELDQLRVTLAGWQDQMAEPNGLAWLVERCNQNDEDGDADAEDGVGPDPS